MSYSTSSIIPFDSGRSYVVRDLPLSERTDYRFEDKMGRTEKDKTFLKQFEAIFLAASKGDLAGCERVVKEGFRDFRAYSIGRYGTGPNNRLDHVSPLQIAEQRGHATIVEFFKRIMNESSLTSSPTSPGTLNPFGQLPSDGKELLSLFVEDKNFESNMAETTHDSSFGPNKEIKPSNLLKQSTSSLSKNTFKNKFGIKCLESTPTSVFFEKPSQMTIDENSRTNYASSQKIETLIEELKEKGPLIGLGQIGPAYYTEEPFKLGKKLGGQDIYGCKAGTRRSEPAKQSYAIILGAKKDKDGEFVYFSLSQDATTNTTDYLRQHKPSDAKIYVTSHKTFKNYLCDLYSPISAKKTVEDSQTFFISSNTTKSLTLTAAEKEYVQKLSSLDLESILDESEGEKMCKAIGQDIFDTYKHKADGKSVAGMEAVIKICEAVASVASDGFLRKQYIERAWNRIGDQNWQWMA